TWASFRSSRNRQPAARGTIARPCFSESEGAISRASCTMPLRRAGVERTAAVATETALIPEVEDSIRQIRGARVMVDADLAALYGVETRALTQAVRRNLDRFPDDFMFQLTDEEFEDLRSQTVISSQWGGRRTRPYVFTEQGVAMLSSVLRSDRAVQVNIEIMRAFVRLRRMLASNAELERRL